MTRRLVFVLHRRPEMTRDEFQRYWSGSHAPLVCSVADVLGIIKYQQVHTVMEDPTYGGTPFDGVAELWFDPLRGTGTVEQQRDAGALLLADERTFIDLTASPMTFGDEAVVREGPHDGMRMTATIYRRPGTTRAEFRRYWREVHAPLAVAHPEVLGTGRYVQVTTPDDAESFPGAIARNAPAPFDGFGEGYFQNVALDHRDAASVIAELAADTSVFADTTRTVATFGRVDVIIDG